MKWELIISITLAKITLGSLYGCIQRAKLEESVNIHSSPCLEVLQFGTFTRIIDGLNQFAEVADPSYHPNLYRCGGSTKKSSFTLEALELNQYTWDTINKKIINMKALQNGSTSAETSSYEQNLKKNLWRYDYCIIDTTIDAVFLVYENISKPLSRKLEHLNDQDRHRGLLTGSHVKELVDNRISLIPLLHDALIPFTRYRFTHRNVKTSNIIIKSSKIREAGGSLKWKVLMKLINYDNVSFNHITTNTAPASRYSSPQNRKRVDNINLAAALRLPDIETKSRVANQQSLTATPKTAIMKPPLPVIPRTVLKSQLKDLKYLKASLNAGESSINTPTSLFKELGDLFCVPESLGDTTKSIKFDVLGVAQTIFDILFGLKPFKQLHEKKSERYSLKLPCDIFIKLIRDFLSGVIAELKVEHKMQMTNAKLLHITIGENKYIPFFQLLSIPFSSDMSEWPETDDYLANISELASIIRDSLDKDVRDQIFKQIGVKINMPLKKVTLRQSRMRNSDSLIQPQDTILIPDESSMARDSNAVFSQTDASRLKSKLSNALGLSSSINNNQSRINYSKIQDLQSFKPSQNASINGSRQNSHQRFNSIKLDSLIRPNDDDNPVIKTQMGFLNGSLDNPMSQFLQKNHPYIGNEMNHEVRLYLKPPRAQVKV